MASSGHAVQLRDCVQPTIKIYIKDLRDRHGRKRPLTIRMWSTIKDVKDQIQQLLHVPPSAQRLFFGPLLISGKELPNHRSLHDVGIYKSGETLLLDIKSGSVEGGGAVTNSITSLRASGVSDICISSSMLNSTSKPMRRIIQQCRRGLMLGLKPSLVMDGSGGTYFLHDARKVKIAVFKPADEEPYAENNPRGYVKQDDHDIYLREGIRPGESCLREVAAFLLDHDGFSSVPMTTLAEARHPAFHTNGSMLNLTQGGAALGINPFHATFQNSTQASTMNSSTMSTSTGPELMKKIGSCQEFVLAEDTMDDLSPSKLSVDEVQKIAILDIRLMNADRNSANLLVKRNMDNSLELVPIDHGYCLRSVCDVAWFDWCWLDWPQLKKPLSKKCKKYVLNLDIDADVNLLRDSLQISTEALDFFRASNKILQAGVKAGLTLYEIATMCCRNDDAGELQSRLEVLTTQAKELSLSAIKNGRWGHAIASSAIAQQISHNPRTIRDFADLSSSSNISKSKSLANFSSFAIDFSSAEESPASVQISGSESSASDYMNQNDNFIENDDNDQDDCQEWAAGLVAGVENLESPFRSRSFSANSYDSFRSNESSSPIDSGSSHGFWRVHPGDAEIEDNLSWARSSSSPSLHSISSRVDISSINDCVDEIPRKSNVTFIDISSEEKVSHNDAIKNDQKLSKQNSVQISFSPPARQGYGLVRSHSYSAFSFRDLGEELPSTTPVLRNRSNSTESDIFRQYFHKFIDLLIERETVAAARRKEKSAIKD